MPVDRLVIRDGDVDTAVVAQFEAERRALVRRGLAVGGAVLFAGAIPALVGVRNAFAESEGDAAILEAAIGLEQIAVFAYGAAVDSGLLDGATTKVAARFRDHEQEHADALIAALRRLGGKAPGKPSSGADVDDVIGGGFKAARRQADLVQVAIELETAALAAYYDAHQKLQDARLLQTGAAIMANEGQHLVVLRQALQQDPVPHAFETGEATS